MSPVYKGGKCLLAWVGSGSGLFSLVSISFLGEGSWSPFTVVVAMQESGFQRLQRSPPHQCQRHEELLRSSKIVFHAWTFLLWQQ